MGLFSQLVTFSLFSRSNLTLVPSMSCPILHSLDVLRKLIVEWIVQRRHSFNETESEALHKIFEYLDPRSTTALMSARTIGRDITKYFETAKAIIKECLSLARSRIHISYDLWTSLNHKAIISIVAH